MIKYNVPFYANPDLTHCYQATLRSILKYFLPEKEYSWKELEEMTAKKTDFWTWPTQGLLTLHNLGFEVIRIGSFDAEAFVDTGEAYLLKEYGQELADEQIKHSDIPQERLLHKEYLQVNKNEKRIPTFADIKNYLDQGYLTICNVNLKKLNGKEGYVGHFVTIFGYDETHIYFHDPGTPPDETPHAERKMSYEEFMQTWAYPNEKAINLIAVKYGTS